MSLPGLNEPIPFWDALVNKAGQVTQTWTQWLEQTLLPQVRAGTLLIGRYAPSDPLSDALTATILEEALPSTAVYVLTLALQVTQAAGVGSSVQASATWTSNGIVQTQPFTAIVNGTATDHQSNVIAFLADGGTPVSIATTYASNPANAMEYLIGATLAIQSLPGQEVA